MIDLRKLEKIKLPVDVEQEAAVEVARRYLLDTDWYILRQVETGQTAPEDIKAGRNAARDTIGSFATET